MDLPALLPAPTARGGQHGGGPGPLRRAPAPLGPSPARRRLLLVRGPEDGGPGARPGEASGPSPPPVEDDSDGDSFLVLLEVPHGAAAAEAAGSQEAEPGSRANPASRPEQGPSGPAAAPGPGVAPAGAVTISSQDLLVRLDRGVLALSAPPGPASAGPAAPRRAPQASGPSTPSYRCPEPQCALAFAKKHQLKVHLLTHGGGQGRRPFKCPLEGCGWAFTTSYKLKRHLQSHDKLRPFGCPVGGCGKKFTTVYNLKAHMKGHEQESLFKCEVCAERFPTHAKLSSHQRSHFEPERPYKCDFPGCEKTFITVSALFSHNRAHFREQELFSCSFPGCSKQYDKACRLKIHLRSHTGERPFICDSDSCGWTFTSMSKLLRHRRKHDDDRRFTCPVEGCGKSFTRAEHLKGHSITHLGTKPFECPVEGCCARFSARSSLYIHSKKHMQDVGAPKSRCPVSTCNRLFTSKHSMKAHMVRQHSRRQDLLPQLEAPSSLTPSSELSSPGQSELTNMDLAALFSDTPANASGSAGGSDEALNSGILTIDVTSVSSSLGGNLPASNSSLGPMEPLVLVAHSDISPSLDSPLVLGTAATVLQQGSFSVDDVQTVSAGALGCLVALPMKNLSDDPLALTSSSNLAAHITTPTSSSTPQENASVPELLAPIKVEPDSPSRPGAAGQQEGSHGLPQSTLSSPAERHGAQDTELSAGTGNFYLESGGSARTDYRAIQLAKEKKQRGAGSNAGASQSTQRKIKEGKMSPPHFHASQSSWLCGSLVVPSGGRPGPAPAAGVQCGAQGIQVQLVQDDPSGEGVLPSTRGPAAFLPFLTVDLPVYVLQEVLPSSGGPSGPEATQFPGSTINLQDLQ
ncbi:zinc finger protein ZXDC isoform X2 [Trachypithecus francoisi]|uniref:zinc finger protein ZXDC isoform X2 n=1 Tax=Trachypithecus francoisi TaxID=54180 RepID=UPI00141B0E51|nr:zinc finger protein ZXDC isoform X2 [Trachypithecus francoisi]